MFAALLPFMISNWKVLTVIAVSAFLFFAGWKLRDYQADAEALKAAEEHRKAFEAELQKRDNLEKEYTKIATDLETKLATIRAQRDRTLKERMDEYSKPAYANCVLPADGLRIINEAISNGNKSRASR